MEMDRVSSLMTKDMVHTISPRATAREAAERMRTVGTGCLVVVLKGKPVGIVTERDLVHKVVAKAESSSVTLVSEVMSSPVITVGPEALLSDAAGIMVKNRIRRLVVTEGTRVVGILTVSDFARHLQRKGLSDPMLDAMARGALILNQPVPA